MKLKKTNNEINYDDIAIAIEVDNGVIEKVQKGEQLDLFDGEYTYRCILTNDWDMTDEEIILHYNKRGAAERLIDGLFQTIDVLIARHDYLQSQNIIPRPALCRAGDCSCSGKRLLMSPSGVCMYAVAACASGRLRAR